MNKLELDQQSLLGAREVADWLKAQLEEMGPDKVSSRIVTSYILSDIEDAISLTKEQVL